LPLSVYIARAISAQIRLTKEAGCGFASPEVNMKERQLTVLIADDALEDRAAVRDALSRDPAASYVVIEAESGGRALDLCRARMPDCLILKGDLPDLHILDALKKLAVEEGSPACAVVVLVDAGDAQLAVEAIMSGAHGCLEKSRVKGAELHRAVSQAIERAEQRRRDVARERELVEKNRALEADLAALRREDAGRKQGEEARQVARTGAGSQRAVVSRPVNAFHNQTEEQLRLLKTAIEQSNESIIIMTAQLDPPAPQIVYVNPAFTKMTGYAPEEVVGQTLHILQGPSTDRSVLSQLCKDCMWGKVFHGEMINYRKDRSEFYLEWTAGPVRNDRGEVTHFAAAQRDVTERRRMEEELRRGEQEFRSLFDLSTVGIAQVSRDYKFLRVNRKLCQMLGYSERELLVRTFLDVTHPDDREISAAQGTACFAGEVAESSFEKRYVRKDGGIIWASVNWAIIPGAEGRPARGVMSVQDITARKQIEEALRTGEAQLHAILDHSVALIFVKDLEGRYLRVNRKYKELFGVTDVELKGKTDYDCHSKEIADAFLANDREVIAANRPLLFEEQALVAGEIRYSVVSKFPLRDGSGRTYAVCGIATDITERKRAEEALRESESRLRQHMDAMPQMVYTCPADGMTDYVNRRWQEYTGVSWERSLGTGWVERLHPDDRDRVWRQWVETVKAGQPFEMEYRLRRKDGQYRWHLSRAIPIRDGQQQIVKWIGTSTDIHDRKEAEAEREELLAREQVARAEAEHSAESIRRLQAVTDSALVRLTLDDLLREMLARIRELLATDAAAILLLTEDGQSLSVRATIGWKEAATGLRVPFGQGVAGSIAASRAPFVVEDISAAEVINPVLRRNARSLIGAPLIVEGRLIGVIHADTTRPRRFTEDDVRLLQLAADRVALAIEHARLYEVERQARRQAEDANRLKDEFLSTVSHELRTPLTAINGWALMLRAGRLDAAQSERALETIVRSARSQNQLIDDLLDVSRIITGRMRLAVAPLNLGSVIKAAVETVRPAAEAKGIRLSALIAPEAEAVSGDAERLQQVVWNLLSNAVKFAPQGGRVEVRLERADSHVEIVVADNGQGIKPEFLPYVFERFRQEDGGTNRQQGGLGLGLAIVRNIVELHGGTVHAASEGLGKGATFTVALPIASVRAVAPDESRDKVVGGRLAPENPSALAGVRALFVDDEADARELITMMLAQGGAEVRTAVSATEALASCDEWRPDVLISDIGMPGEDGYMLMKKLRARESERGGHIPAIALTAYGRQEDRMRALSVGYEYHIPKPVDPAELLAVVASLTNRIGKNEEFKGSLS
jgi:PAS domain S-box-containing protein